MAHRATVDAIKKVARSPEVVREYLARMEISQLRSKPNPGLFSPLEDVWHLRDIEREGYVRGVYVRSIAA